MIFVVIALFMIAGKEGDMVAQNSSKQHNSERYISHREQVLPHHAFRQNSSLRKSLLIVVCVKQNRSMNTDDTIQYNAGSHLVPGSRRFKQDVSISATQDEPDRG